MMTTNMCLARLFWSIEIIFNYPKLPKNFAMTGWRVGFVFGDKGNSSLTGLTSQSTSGVATVSQWAAVAALQIAGP